MRSSQCVRPLVWLGIAFWAPSALAQAPAPGAASGAAPANGSSLSAGGLAPPPALENTPPPAGAATPAQTEAELAKADKEDSGRGLEFVWMNGEVGVMHLGLGTFSNDNLVDTAAVNTTQTGLVLGAGIGVRLVFLTLGTRFRYAPLPDAKLWTLGLEAGLHAPFGSLEPSVTLGVGYVSVGSFPGPVPATARGFDARLGAALDYYLTNMFSVGVNAGAELLVLSRSSICAASSGPSTYCSEGSSTGGALTATGVAGLHF